MTPCLCRESQYNRGYGWIARFDSFGVPIGLGQSAVAGETVRRRGLTCAQSRCGASGLASLA